MKKLSALLILLIAFSSCRKLPDFENLSYDLVVMTSRDTRVNFSDYHTYRMPKYIGLISDHLNDTILPASIADQLKAAIRSNMNANGYTEDSIGVVDLGISSSVITLTNTVSYYYPGGWWGYGGWYGGCIDWYYCGGYYPSYPPYYSSYTYQTGSLVIEVADLKNVPTTGNKINMIWLNFNTGVMGSAAQNTAAGVEAINTAFQQSPYFKHAH